MEARSMVVQDSICLGYSKHTNGSNGSFCMLDYKV